MADDDEGGSFLGGFGAKAASKFGAGAAKVGKKAAQSEAGRKASKAAIKGASDSIRDDMMSRFDDPKSPTSPKPAAPSKSSESSSKATQEKNSVPSWMDDNDDKPKSHSSNTGSSSSSSSSKKQHYGAPPKPSLLGKFKLNVNMSSSKQAAPTRTVHRQSRDKVYKQRLAKSADWDRLPLAQALYNFKGKMKCDLEFRKGQMIKVITRTDDQFDWWEGKIEDRVGIFPANYVKMV